MTATNKPMTGAQLDELMAVAVNFQRDSEKAGEGGCATFAYAVQVAVLEIREVRSMYEELQSQNAELAVQLANAESKCRELAAECKTLSRFISGSCYVFDGDHDDDMPDEFIDASHYMPIVTPATDAFLAEVRAQESKRVYESILDNPAVTDMESLVDWLEQYANDSVAFAAQLRKGAAL